MLGLAVPIVTMICSDFILGFHQLVPFVYVAIFLSGVMGAIAGPKIKAKGVFGISLSLSLGPRGGGEKLGGSVILLGGGGGTGNGGSWDWCFSRPAAAFSWISMAFRRDLGARKQKGGGGRRPPPLCSFSSATQHCSDWCLNHKHHISNS